MELIIKIAGGIVLGLVFGYIAKKKRDSQQDTNINTSEDDPETFVFRIIQVEKIIYYIGLVIFAPSMYRQ